MQNPILYFEKSPGFLILCLLVGAAYAALMYYPKKGPWSIRVHYLLTAMRFVVVSLLSALLIGPFLKQNTYNTEEPTVVFAIDNSQSLAAINDSTTLTSLKERVGSLAAVLVEQGFTTEFRTLDQARPVLLEDISFTTEKTDLVQGIQYVQNDYEGRNLAKVILISDGIYNAGTSPAFKNYHFDIHTVGIGDTLPKSDISIKNLVYNKISYQGNRFPLIAEVINKGYEGQQVRVTVSQGGKTLSSQRITFEEDNGITPVEFYIAAEQKGVQRYEVNVELLSDEFLADNNSKQAYVDVIEGKEKLLLIAPAPHPDIKAMTAALQANANYQLELYIPGIHEAPAKTTPYDLVIFHQAPDKQGICRRLFQDYRKQGVAYLLFVAGQSDLALLNNIDDVVSLRANRQEKDEVNGVFNTAFNHFSLSDELRSFLDNLPPLTVPFGRPVIVGDAQTLLYQRVGSITTQKPLIALSATSPKRAVFLGEGVWRWRMHEYAKNEDTKGFDELMTKMVQFLSSKEDRRKFKAYPVQNEFSTSENIVFDTEVYNDLYERVYGNKIDISISNEDKERKDYSFITNENNTRYSISDLEEGVYDYVARTQINGQPEKVSGQFIVKKLSIENVNLTADFDLLRTLAENTGGTFHTLEEWGELEKTLGPEEAKAILHSSENYLPLINLKWLFFLLLLLISIEWFLRKFHGSY